MFCRKCGAPVAGDAEFCQECQAEISVTKGFNAFPMALVSMIVSVVGPSMMSFIVKEFETLKDQVGINIAMLVIGAACLTLGIIAVSNVGAMKKAKLGKTGVTLTLGILAIVFSSFVIMNNLHPIFELIKEGMDHGTIL